MSLQREENNQSKEIFSFQLLGQDGRARAGIFNTPHGEIQTPVFAPVGTQAAVKALTPAQLHDVSAQMVLANTYHLYLRPGFELVREFGSLHRFMGWEKPILTDSGGFQVFSLAEARKIDEDGVTFRSHLDGSYHRFTPEKSIEVQEGLGADIIMAFDECAPPYDYEYSRAAMERTHQWALRSMAAKTRKDQALFGIVQGGVFPDLREKSALFIAELGFPGNAIGGLSVGETKEEMAAMVDVVTAVLPEDRPRYLMGVGSPEDLVEGVRRGIDLFDCVLPTRLARHKAAFTSAGRVNLTRKEFFRDQKPIEEGCGCYTCNHFSRAYLRHLFLAKESLVGTLVSIHNVYMLIDLMQRMRVSILAGQFDTFSREFLSKFQRSGE
jgi:queuine tRNA-ribosyltransferase